MTRNKLAAVDAATGAATAWDPNANGNVWALAVSGDTVYAGGPFAVVNQVTRNRLAAFGSDGRLTDWDPDASGTVSALAVSGGTVYAGGSFTTVCRTAASTCWNGSAEQTRNRVAAFGSDGSLKPWDPNANGGVNALAINGSTVYLGGAFNGANSINGNLTRNWLAAVDATTGTATAWDPDADNTVNALAVSGNTVYAGGRFTSVCRSNASTCWNGSAAQTRNLLAAFGGDGSLKPWNPNASISVSALAVSGSTVYVGGALTAINGGALTRNRLAAVDATTGTATAWNPDVNNTVNALTVSGGTIYAGGSFTLVCRSAVSTCWNGSAEQTRNRLAAFGADGSLAPWNPAANTGTVYSLLGSGDTLYAGGSFTALAGERKTVSPASYLAALNGPPCGPGIALPIGPPALWQQFALPCVPDASPASVSNVLAAGDPDPDPGQLDPLDYNSGTANYNAGHNWWRLFRRDNTANANVLMPLDGASGSDLMSPGPGYWLKSLDAPAGGGNLVVTGTATPTDVTLEQGCAVAAGCKAIDLVVAANRYNMIGNPFPYNVDWAQVRIQIDGSASTLTPSEAETAGYLAKSIWIWNGTSYATSDDSTLGMIGNLKYFQSFWVKVLPGAVTHTLRLLIPAVESTHSQLAPTGGERLAATRPWYQAWLDALIPPAGAAELALPPDAGQQTPGHGPERRPAPRGAVGPAPTDPTLDMLTTMGTSDGLDPAAAEQAAHAQAQAEGREWYLRLKVDEPATGYRDHNSVLGQLLTAKNGRDPADLGEMPPFATPYLTLVFPHPEWGTAAGDYASDFRSAQRLNSRNKPVAGLPAADWAFEIRTDRPGTPVVLTWEGPPEILKRSRLIDRATGRTLIPTAKAYAKGYRVTLTSGKGAFIWRFLGQP